MTINETDHQAHPATVLDAMPTARRCPFSPPAEFTQLRKEQPIVKMVYPDGHVGWLVTSYDLTRKILVSPDISARHELRSFPVPVPFKLGPAQPGVFVGMDAPEHTRYRKPLVKAFSATQARLLEPTIERITNEVLDAMEKENGSTDLLQTFALPIPIKVITEVLGGSQKVTEEFSSLRVPVLTPGTPPEQVHAAMVRTGQLMHELVTSKRANPSDDLLSSLIAEDEFTDTELSNIALAILGAGHETTAHMITLGAYLLLQDDELRRRLTVEGHWTNEAADELLRYLTIAHFVTRAALTDVEFAGQLVKKGESITMMLSTANRDGDRFTDPDAFDPERPNNTHLTWGHGVHKCVGVHLAKTELRIVMPALFRRFPNLRLDIRPEDIETRDAMSTYGVKSLPVRW